MDTFSSRKFLLFLVVILTATGGWVYALLSDPEQLVTISTFLVTLLGTYSGANLGDKYFKKPNGAAPALQGDPNVK